MKTASTKTYRENRDKFPADQLRQYEGQWVAFSADGGRVVASAPSISEVAVQLQSAREALRNVVFEHIETESTEINLGAAELL